jgi:hypothetical protein
MCISDQETIDAEEWARLTKRDEYEARASAATQRGAQALARLLDLAETRRSGQIERVALFLGAAWNGRRHFDLYDLRTLDVSIGDDMLAVLDALRWGRVGIPELVPQGDSRIQKVLDSWGMFGPGQTGQAIC